MAKSKLTPELQAKVVQALRAGNYRKAACAFAGISEGTLYRWISDAEADIEAGRRTRHREFYEAVKRAEAEAEVEAVAMIRKAMPDDWKAAAHYLERRHPEAWGRKDSRQEAILAELAAELSMSTAREVVNVLAMFAQKMGLDPASPEVKEAGRAALQLVAGGKTSQPAAAPIDSTAREVG